MTHPMSLASRIRRAAAGLTLTVLAVLWIGMPWTWAGIVPLAAGLAGWCPFQALRVFLAKKWKGAGAEARCTLGGGWSRRVLWRKRLSLQKLAYVSTVRSRLLGPGFGRVAPCKQSLPAGRDT